MIWFLFWWLVLCAIHAFHICLGVSYSIWRMRTPLILSDYLRGLHSIWLWRFMVTIWYDLFLCSWWITIPFSFPYTYSLTYPLNHITSVWPLFLLFCTILYFCLLSLYLFTGLFKLSRTFSFRVRQVISRTTGLGMSEETFGRRRPW